MACFNSIITIILFFSTTGLAQDFDYTEVLPVPTLEFHPGIFTGLDVIEEMGFKPISGHNLAILTNQTALNRKGIHLLDLLATRENDFNVKIIFTPEFGFLSSKTEKVTMSEQGKDPWLGAQVKNLWGREFLPDINDLREVDLILIDLQDPGIRFFSFMTTVTKVMEAAATYDIPVLILDRPNPLNGVVIDGPVVRPQYQSFLGYHLVPVRHGLTLGEYAIMVNESGWIRKSERVELTVIPMVNWDRGMWMDETEIPQVPLAPNIGDVLTLLSYAGMGLFEGTNVSAGVGTDIPYLQIGSPWLLPEVVLESLERKHLPGVKFTVTTFYPDSLSAIIPSPRYTGQRCYGIRLLIFDRNKFSPVLTAATILSVIIGHHPHKFHWEETNYVDTLYGHDYLRIFLAQERDPLKLPATWSRDVIKFSQFRGKFLLY